MALDDLLISTGVDQLIKLIKERGRVELSDAAKEMKQPVRTIEDWAHVLEEEGLVNVEYRLTKVYLVWRAPTPEYVAQKSEKLEAKASEAKSDIEQLLSKVEEGGSELASMQQELSKLKSAMAMSPEEVEKLKAEMAELQRKYNASIKSASEKLAKLKKKMLALSPQAGENEGKGERDAEKELAILRNFESTLQSQISDNETFFEAFETRLEDFRKRIEEGKPDARIAELKSDIAELKSLKSELLGAIEAVAEEQKSVSEKVAALDKKISDFAEQEYSLASAKKKLAELRKMREDAKKQRAAINEQLADALSLVKRHAAKIREMEKREYEAAMRQQELKDEYIDIAEEISLANDELARKEKEISARIASQLASLAEFEEKQGSLREDELEKVAYLLQELRKEQELLEGRVRALRKESDIISMSAESAKGKAGSLATQAEKEQAAAFVEKVKLSQQEESEFERKREELRALIHKMWEESRGSGS